MKDVYFIELTSFVLSDDKRDGDQRHHLELPETLVFAQLCS